TKRRQGPGRGFHARGTRIPAERGPPMTASPATFSSALLVEDERNLAVALEIALRKLGIPCDLASTLEQARRCLERRPGSYEFILLDRNLPDGDGLSLCAQLRKDGYPGTILVL